MAGTDEGGRGSLLPRVSPWPFPGLWILNNSVEKQHYLVERVCKVFPGLAIGFIQLNAATIATAFEVFLNKVDREFDRIFRRIYFFYRGRRIYLAESLQN